MNRLTLFSLLALIAVPLFRHEGRAGEPPPPAKGFDVIEPGAGANAAGNGKEPETVGLPPEVEVLKIWTPKTMSDPSDNLVSGVDSIELLSNGRVRWNFFLWNQAERAKRVEIDMNNSYVADAEGETYRPVAREFVHNDVSGYRTDVQPRAKFKFRLEFAAPPEKTRQFRAGIVGVVIGSGRHLPQFDLKLEKPDKPLPIPRPHDKGDPDPARDATPKLPRRKSPSPVGTEEELAAIRDIYTKGQTYEGDIKIGTRMNGRAKLVFEPTEDGGILLAHISSEQVKGLDCDLTGRIVEDKGAKSKIGFMFLAGDGTGFSFRLKGTTLEGFDTKGRKFLMKAK